MSKIKFYTSDGQMYFEMEEEKMNKEQKMQELTERIEKSQAEIDELKQELEKLQKKPYEISYPEDDTEIYYIDDYTGKLKEKMFDICNDYDKHLYEIGLLFYTKEEAEQFKRERALIKKIKCWAKEQQGDWKPNWKDGGENKYYIFYNNGTESLMSGELQSLTIFTKLPYFKSKEIAESLERT